MDQQQVSNFQTMSVTDDDVNILLLGETGVGKSTFINSFANYIEYDKFEIAEGGKVRCVVPAKFTVTNENFDEKIVEIGKDDNENNSISESATLQARSYVFPISKQRIGRLRLIDTPGIGDTRGLDQDNQNMENILSYISHLENLHAICFLLKPNNTRLTVMFDYCIKQLLSRLEKGASKNIIFLFTNTRATFYKPGDTTTILKTLLQEIERRPPNVEIKFCKDNVFCLDNESFRYLVAVKNGVQLGNKESFVDSWKHSVAECWRMLHFITGQGNYQTKITPHKVKDTVSVNEARRVILQLSQPLADIADLINDNIKVLERHNRDIQMDNLSIADLRENLYVPVINLRCKELSQPITVCTAKGCTEIYSVNNIKKYHYKQRCHNPCYLPNVPREHIGSPELVNCWAMSNRKCKICNCDFTSHMHIYYESETYDDQIDNEGVKAQLKDRESALKETRKLVTKMETRKLSYENEKETIIKTMAKFAHFLQRNAIAPYNDAYKAYIEYLIDREKSEGEDCDMELIKYYNDVLRRYHEEKTLLDNALLPNSNFNSNVTATTVFEAVQTLYNLPNTGSKIKLLHSQMGRSQSNEHKNTEMVFEDVNEQLKQRKQNKNDTKPKQNQKQNNKGRMFINQNNQPHMKGRDKYSENNRGRHNYQQNYEQRHMNTRGFNHSNYQNQYPGNRYNEQFFFVPPHLQPGPSYPPNSQGQQYPYSRNPFPGHSGQGRHPQNVFPEQPGQGRHPQNLFPEQPGHMSQPYIPPLMSGQPLFQNYSQNHLNPPNYVVQENQSRSSQNFEQFHKGHLTNRTRETTADFEEWYRDISSGTGNNFQKNNTTGERRYNHLSKKHESSEDDTSGDSSKSDRSNGDYNDDNDDDEDFKEFMKKNNLEYLVKDSSTNAEVNKIKKSAKKRNNKNDNTSRSNFHQDDSDSDEPKKGGRSKSKGSSFFKQVMDFF